jgi:hypothetical protein
MYSYKGYTFKMPIFCYNKSESTSGFIITTLLFSAINVAGYFILEMHKKMKNIEKSKEF